MPSPIPGRSLLWFSRDEPARIRRSRRCLAAIIADSAARSWTLCLLSSRTPRMMSATRSTAALSSSSANRAAAIPADSCLLSLFVGCPAAGSVLARVAPWRRPPLAKVVAGVVERGRVSVA